MDGLSFDEGAEGRPTAGVKRPDAGRRSPHATFKPAAEARPAEDAPRKPRVGRMVAGLILFYAVAAILATWPFALSFSHTLPANGDPSEHLWIMNWNKHCLLEGKSPFSCADLQYPVGAPLGLFSPLHIESAMFIPLSIATHNDVLSYNIIWLIGLVTTGLGVFALAWQVTGHRAASAIGGLLAMLSGPVMLHAHAHLELHFIGTIALFLAAWLKLLERPSWKTLAAAVAGYVLMGSCAAYFIVLTVAPACWIAAWRLVELTRERGQAALVGRLKWLAGFSAATLPFVALLMSYQLWAVAHGSVMTRSSADFTAPYSNAPLWGYLVPTSYHTLSRYAMPVDPWLHVGNPTGYFVIERASYLGIVALLLMAYALFHRVGGRRALIWWSLLGVVVVLGLGCYARFGTHEVSLPTMWLRQTFPPFRFLRTPARFNLLVAIPAAVLAAYGLGHLLQALRRPAARAGVLLALVAVTIVDLGMLPYEQTYRLNPMPASYTWLKRRDPDATLFEWPISGPQTADRTYWQLAHGMPTSEGYSGVNNMTFIHRIVMFSPLAYSWQPDFLARPLVEGFGPVRDAGFHDYLWVYLKANGYRYLVLHDDDGPTLGHPFAIARLKEQLAGAKIYEDGKTTIYEHSRLPVPARPVLACTEGWRTNAGMAPPFVNGVGKVGRVVLYNPTPGEPLAIELEAAACRSARQVRLMAGAAELARWTIEPGDPKSYRCPPITLPAGVQELAIESDSEQKPRGTFDSLDEAKTPYSLQVSTIRVRGAR